MRLSVHGPRPRGCRAVSQVQQTHALSLPHGDLVSPNGFGFWRYEVGNLGGHVARLYGLRSVVVPMEKVAGCVKCAGRQELPWLDAHRVDCTNEGDKRWIPIAYRNCIRTRKSHPLDRQRSH